MILVLWVEAYWQLFILRALTGIGKNKHVISI